MKATTKTKLKKYEKTVMEAVKAGTKYNMARKVLLELPRTDAINKALEEIEKKVEYYKAVYKNTTHNIAVLELKEGI
ncbi:hypothetical protein ES703_24189 [subsurface metagenome]